MHDLRHGGDQLRYFGLSDRRRDQITLQVERGVRGQAAELSGALHTFRRHLDAEILAQQDQRHRNRGGARLCIDARDQRAVELDARQGKLLERGERGITRAEVVQCDRDVERVQLPEGFDGGGTRLQYRLGELELDAACRQLELV